MSSGVHFKRTATVGSTVPQQSKEFSGIDVSILLVAMFLTHAAHIQSVGPPVHLAPRLCPLIVRKDQIL